MFLFIAVELWWFGLTPTHTGIPTAYPPLFRNRTQVGELLRRHGESGLPRLDPVEDMDIRDPKLPEVRKLHLLRILRESASHTGPRLTVQLAVCFARLSTIYSGPCIGCKEWPLAREDGG